MVSELHMLMENLDDTQIEMLSIVAVRIARLKADGFTGQTIIELNTNQGSIGDSRLTQSEVVRIGGSKKRKVRSALR